MNVKFFLWMFFNFLFWGEWIVFWVSVQVIVVCGFLAVHIVPPIACKILLVKNGSVGAKEWGTLITFTTIVAGVVGLTSGLYIGVHSRNSWYVGTRKWSVWNCMIYWIINSWHSRDLAEILFILFGLLLLHVNWFLRMIQVSIWLKLMSDNYLIMQTCFLFWFA
jgi:hypothetical protein